MLQEQPRLLLAAPWLASLPAGAAHTEGTPRGNINPRGLQQTKAAGPGEGRRRTERTERRQPTVAFATAGDGGDGALSAPASRYKWAAPARLSLVLCNKNPPTITSS